MHPYAPEAFTLQEQDVLRRYVTNLDLPVFALVNLPEVVKGALFARYSRSHKSLRRLLLDEFIDDLDIAGDATVDATVGVTRAEELYLRVFTDYGDDSVAQLGAVHLACEQASNLLTKVLERGRLMSYLEQSTRYLNYGARIQGRYRYARPPEIMGSVAAARYITAMDAAFDAYSDLVTAMNAYWLREMPQPSSGSDLAQRRAVRAKALDSSRGLLPAASLSNVGIFGSGQAYEALMLRMRASPLPEARSYCELMLGELRKVIPSFLRRLDIEDRGVAWRDYLARTQQSMTELAEQMLDGEQPAPTAEVELVDWDPDGEDKMLAAMLYPYSSLSQQQLAAKVAEMTPAQRCELVRRYVGDRSDRRHRPGRALETLAYRFDVLGDYAGFRDLQRHRMLTIEWQPLGTEHGYAVPAAVEAAGEGDRYREAMERSAAICDDIGSVAGPIAASYAAAMAYRVRYVMQFNAREAMHLIELRTQPQGHDDYRRVAQEMLRLIAEKAGHRAVADMLTFADLSDAPCGRLSAEQATMDRRA